MFDDSDPKRSTETSQAILSNPHDDGLIFAGYVKCRLAPTRWRLLLTTRSSFGTALRLLCYMTLFCLHVEAYVALTPAQPRLLVQQHECNANI